MKESDGTCFRVSCFLNHGRHLSKINGRNEESRNVAPMVREIGRHTDTPVDHNNNPQK
jgi:hypothetical protein